MSLKPCRECKATISTDCKVCPMCGAKKPHATRGLGAVVVIIAIIGAVFMVGNKSETSTSASTSTSATPANPCKKDWTKCTDNADMANNNSDYQSAHYECKHAADKLAKYGDPKWPWLAFGSFRGGDDYAKTGKAILIEPEAQFQNGFGAWARTRVICTYDMRSKTVTNIITTPK